ncbi:MAG: thiamine phosphate synthase [Acidobacteria bacterium]|nr:thiamine phosphate synthase [Acidobacteriota bacterium]
MIVCLVSDRRRWDPAVQARAAAGAGIDLIQIRERDLDAAALAALTARVLASVEGSRTRVVVNERLDVALACGAHGVHLRSDSMPARAVREVTPAGFLVGRSVHGAADARDAAGGVDFLLAGTVYPTTSKPAGAPLLGAAGLRAIAGATPVPVLAIGGVTIAALDAIARTGAAGIAAIGLFCSQAGIASITPEVRCRFDSLKPRS